jgi:hypothetical protein
LNIFELLFIFLFLVSLVTLASAGGLLVFGRRSAAVRVIRRFSVCLVAYLVVVLLSSLLASRKELEPGEPLCFDDWCITVLGVESSKAQEYVVTASLSSRARRAPQRETGVVLYLTDSSGVRYDSVDSGDDQPFDVRLLPNESVEVSRTYRLPPGTTPAGVVIAHEGGFPISWLIIGEGPFRPPPIVRTSINGA